MSKEKSHCIKHISGTARGISPRKSPPGSKGGGASEELRWGERIGHQETPREDED